MNENNGAQHCNKEIMCNHKELSCDHPTVKSLFDVVQARIETEYGEL